MMVVLDKLAASIQPVIVRGLDFADLAAAVDASPPRASANQAIAPACPPKRTPFPLISTAKRPLSVGFVQPAAPTAISPVVYETLKEPAPIAEQAGHYLPYRPSRICMPDASAHARLTSTSRYAHLDDGPVLDAAERIGRLLAEVMGDDHLLNCNAKCDSEKLVHVR